MNSSTSNSSSFSYLSHETTLGSSGGPKRGPLRVIFIVSGRHGYFPRDKKRLIVSFKNLPSAGLLAAPAV
jgi:hypothetical protein